MSYLPTVEYTHSFDASADSSWVRAVYFDALNDELTYVTSDGWTYQYVDATMEDYRLIVTADSIGATINAWRKNRGGATHLGAANRLNFVQVASKSDAPVVNNTTNVYHLSSAAPVDTVEAVAKVFSLAPVADVADVPVDDLDDGSTVNVTIEFLVNDGEEVKTYRTTAAGLQDALDILDGIGGALGLTMTPVRVTFYL